MVDIEEEIFRYKFSRKKVKDPQVALNRLIRAYKIFDSDNRQWKSPSDKHGSSFYGKTGFINQKEQFCVVKMNYSETKKNHLFFVDKYLQQKDKDEVIEKPELFGNVSYEEYKEIIKNQTSNKTDKKSKKRKESKLNRHYKFISKSNRHYKFILSPELNLSKEQLKDFTQIFMRHVERELGRRFNWQAAVHTNTEHNHVHILVNGFDQDGIRFRFPPGFIKNTCRKITSEILTNIYGYRTEEMMSEARRRRVYAERITEFDEVIFEKMEKLQDEKYCGKIKMTSDQELNTRLSWLKANDFADFSNGEYFIKKEMKKDLTAWGRYKQYKHAKNLYGENKDYELYQSEMGQIRGVVRKIYNMNDEDVWTNAMVIEDPVTKKVWFVPLLRPISESHEGEEVSVCAKLNAKGKLVPDIVFYTDKTKETKNKSSGTERPNEYDEGYQSYDEMEDNNFDMDY